MMDRRPVKLDVCGVLRVGVAVGFVFVMVAVRPAGAQRKTPADPAAAGAPQGKAGDAPDAAGKAGPAGGAGGQQAGAGGAGGGRRRAGGAGAEGDAAKPEKNAWDYSLPSADGKTISLADYKDKYIVVVNLGRKSAYNGQLAALIKLNDEYKSKGVVVLGVPSNEFGAAEPGTNAEIQKVYLGDKVDFPIAGVSKLTGDDELPFYQFLTTSKGAPAGGAVAWNYTKFIVDKKGNVIARFDPDVAPDSPEMKATIDQILDGTYKPKKAAGAGGRGAGAGGEGPG